MHLTMTSQKWHCLHDVDSADYWVSATTKTKWNEGVNTVTMALT